MTTIDELKKALGEAREAIEELPEGEIKVRAFEVILQHLLKTNIAMDLDYGTSSKNASKKTTTTSTPKANGETGVSVDHAKIIEKIKTCDEADAIEQNILSRNSLIDRTLLPLYIVHEYFDNEYGVTSGDINKITTDLGIPIAVSNASKTLSGNAKKYVIGDSLRKRGGVVRYKLHKRGVVHIKSVIAGAPNEVQE